VVKTECKLDRFEPFLRNDVTTAVGILSGLPKVRRIWLFGSVAKGRKPDFRSDVDLAVEGLREEDHLKALGMLDDNLRLPPDLVRWEEANALLRAEIQYWGILLYDRS